MTDINTSIEDDGAFENFDDIDSTSILGNQDGLDFDPSMVVDIEGCD